MPSPVALKAGATTAGIVASIRFCTAGSRMPSSAGDVLVRYLVTHADQS